MDISSPQKQEFEKLIDDLGLRTYKRGLWIAAVIVFIAGGLFIWIADSKWDAYNPIISVIASIFAAICCTLSLNIYEQKKKDQYNRNLSGRLDNIENKLSVLPSGIKKATLESNITKEITALYRESESATSVLIHGKSFINDHKEAIVSRFNKPGSVSKWFFLNPESEYVSLVVKRTQKNNSEEIKRFIIDKVHYLKEEYENSKKLGILEIYYLNTPPMQAVYVFDHTVVECKYYSSNEKGSGSHIIVYEKNNEENSIGHGLADDCIRLEKEAICVFSSRYFESDQKFNEYLGKKAALKSLLGSNYPNFSSMMNNYESLYFVPVYNHDEIVLFFCYRFYQEEGEYNKNRNFYKRQFAKKAIELRDKADPQVVEAPRLFFIKGVGGSASAPRSLKIIRYVYPDSFEINSRGNQMTLKNFGYDPEHGKWKDW